MDRILTKRERIRAKGKSVFLVAAFMFCWMAIFLYGANHDEIVGVFVKIKDTICNVVNAVSVFFESLKLA